MAHRLIEDWFSGRLSLVDKLIYLGSTDTGDPHLLFTTRKDPAFESLEKLRAASGIRIGAQTVGQPQYVSGRIFA